MRKLHTVLLLAAVSISRAAVKETQPFVTAPDSDLNFFRTFTFPDSSSYKTLTLERTTGTLLIGARDRVFGQRSDDITKEVFYPVLWPLPKKDECKLLPHSDNGKKCYNQIQIVQRLNDTHLFICGSNSLVPKNMFLVREGDEKTYSLTEHSTISNALCSLDPSDSVTSLLVQSGSGSGPDIFSTARPEFMSKISLVKKMPQSLLIPTDAMQGDKSTFVASFTDDAKSGKAYKVYVASDEKTIETKMPGPSPTITQVCVNDVGGQNLLDNRWTSLLKVRLSCKTTDEYPLTFDLITDMVPGRNGIIYGTFTTRHDTSRSNAVCSFRLKDVHDAFNSSSFWDTQSRPRRQVSGPVGVPHPGTCVSEGSSSKDLPSELLKFMSTHHLVTEVVKPAYPPSEDGSGKVTFRDPLLIKPGNKFIKIAVEQVKGMDGTTYDLVFVGRSNGQILKFVSIEKGNATETIDLAQYQPTLLPIASMKLSQELGYLYIGTNVGVHQLSTSNCAAYAKSCEFCDPCRMCILSRDPGCAWDASAKQCVPTKNRGTDNSLLQDVLHGDAQTQCSNYKASEPTLVAVVDGGTEVLGHIITNPSVSASWFRVKDSSIKESISNKDGKYRITTDGQLEIANFDASEDAAVYESQYMAGTTILNTSSYNVQLTAYNPMTPVVTALSPRNGLRTNLVDSTGDANGAGFSETTVAAPLAGASLMLYVVLGVAFIVVVGITIAICCILRRRKKRKFSTGNRKNDASPGSLSPRTENATNNNNSRITRVQSELDDRASRPLLTSRQDHSPDVDPESNHVELPTSSQRNARSLDNILDGNPEVRFIDEGPTSDQGPARQNSMREASGRKRVPPARTKSMPGSALYVVYGGKKLMCSTLQRNKAGSWMIEVRPNQSGLSDVAPENDEVIDIINEDSVDGKEMFLPSPDAKSSNPEASDMKVARKAFFEGDHQKPGPGGSPDSVVRSFTSTPNGASAVAKPSIAPKPPHLVTPDGKNQPLIDLNRQASLRRLGQNSSAEGRNGDSTVRGSGLPLKPDGTISAITPADTFTSPRNHQHNREGVVTDVPIKEPTSDIPTPIISADKKRKAPQLTNFAKSTDGSSRNSDSGEQLHGRDIKAASKHRDDNLDSPSKQSRISRGSSSSGDYKSARSSVISDPCPP